MNPHPPLTGFPLAILTLLVVNEMLYRRSDRGKTRLFLLGCLVPCTVVTYISGYWGVDFAKGVSTDLISTHQAYAKFLLLLLFPLALFGILAHLRGTTERWLPGVYYLLLLFALALVIKIGSLGGDLVFVHGAGVQQRP